MITCCLPGQRQRLGSRSCVTRTGHFFSACSHPGTNTTRIYRAAQLLTRLAPHLARVFQHYQTASIHRSVAQAGTRLLDLFDVGVVVVGAGGAIKTISPRAQSMLDEGTDIRLSFSGKLQINSSVANRMLYRVLGSRNQAPKFQTFLLDNTRMTIIGVQKDQLSSLFEGPTAVAAAGAAQQPLLAGRSSRFFQSLHADGGRDAGVARPVLRQIR